MKRLAADSSLSTQLLVGPFLQAIVALDAWGVIAVVLESLGCYLVFVLVFTSSIYLGELLRLDWRRAVQASLHCKYFAKRRAYVLATIDKRIDNPSQRITQDIDEMTRLAGQLLFGSFTASAGAGSPQTVWYVLFQLFMSSVLLVVGVDPVSIAICVGVFVAAALLMTLAIKPVASATFDAN